MNNTNNTPTTRLFDLPDGNTLQVVFTGEGVVYDLFDKDGEILIEYGHDLYEDVLPNEYKYTP